MRIAAGPPSLVRVVRRTGLAAVLAAWSPTDLCAQCLPTWSAQTQGVTYAFATHDEDGPGPIPAAFYLGDVNLDFGGVVTERMARYDGWGWSSVGPGLGRTPTSLPVYALLDAPEISPAGGLFAGGTFNRSGQRPISTGIAEWRAGAWNSVGGGVEGYLLTMAVFDEDAGGPLPPVLFVGGPRRVLRGRPDDPGPGTLGRDSVFPRR